MSSVPFEPEAPPQRALYMHEVYSRARLASTDGIEVKAAWAKADAEAQAQWQQEYGNAT